MVGWIDCREWSCSRSQYLELAKCSITQQSYTRFLDGINGVYLQIVLQAVAEIFPAS